MDKFLWSQIVNLLQSVSADGISRSEAVSDMGTFMRDWKESGESIWPALRLLLPHVCCLAIAYTYGLTKTLGM